MLLATCLVFASAVLRVQLLRCPTRQFQFVNVGDKAKICCNYAEKAELPGHIASWHKRKVDEVPLLVYSCRENKTGHRYVCGGERQMLTLEIKNAQVTDSGQYLCAKRDHDIYLGSSLIVGDSYTPSTRVTLLQPPAGEPPALPWRHGPLACLVQGVSNLVQVSWHTPEGPQRGSRTLLVRNSSGSLTFLKLLHIPADAPPGGGSVACQVRFNASGSRVEKSARIPAASSAEDCASYVVPLAVAGLLLLLLLLLSLVWKPRCLSRPGRARNRPLGIQGSSGSDRLPPVLVLCMEDPWKGVPVLRYRAAVCRCTTGRAVLRPAGFPSRDRGRNGLHADQSGSAEVSVTG